MNSPQLDEDKIKEVMHFLSQSNAIEDVWGQEMLIQAYEAWEYIMTKDNLNPDVVRKVHKILMLCSDLEPNEIGYYRECPVWIGGVEAPLFQRLPEKIKEWCKDMNEIERGTDQAKEVWAKVLHIAYERIHPFVDGNGRTGRIFMNWHRIKKLGLPLLTIHTGKEQQEYYGWFK